MEAAYHFNRCILSAPEAKSTVEDKTLSEGKPTDPSWVYPLFWCRLGLIQLIKTLRLGSRALKFWFDKPQFEEWFDLETTNGVRAAIDKVLANIKQSPLAAIDETAKNMLDSENILKIWRKELDDDHFTIKGEPLSLEMKALLQAKLQVEPIRDTARRHRAADLLDQASLSRGAGHVAPELGILLSLQDLLASELLQLSTRQTQQFRIHQYVSLRGVVGRSLEVSAPHPLARYSEVGGDEAEKMTWIKRVRLAINDAKNLSRWWEPLDLRSETVTALLEKTESLASPGVTDLSPETSPLSQELLSMQIEQFRSDPAIASVLMQELIEWSFILLRRAKHEEHAVPLSKQPNLPGFRKPSSPKAAYASDYQRIILTPPEVRGQWVRVCIFARWAIDLERWLPPGLDDFCAREMSKALGIYGIALARLHRFHEAQRRFTQAHAVLTQLGGPTLHVLHGVLDIRRAEAYLLEANLARDLSNVLYEEWGKRSCAKLSKDNLRQVIVEGGGSTDTARWFTEYVPEDRRREAIWRWLEHRLIPLDAPRELSNQETVADRLNRFAAARRDDAWGCLELAERRLGGRTHSVRWWGRLRALQLRALGTRPSPLRELRPELQASRREHFNDTRPLSHRLRHEPQNLLAKLWNDGVAAAPDDDYNRIRMLDYYVRALPVKNSEIEREFRYLCARKKGTLKNSLQSGYLKNVELRIGRL